MEQADFCYFQQLRSRGDFIGIRERYFPGSHLDIYRLRSCSTTYRPSGNEH